MDQETTRNAVREAYSEAARKPKGPHPFPLGRRFARSVGYPTALLKTIPRRSIESFTGVSNVSVFAAIGVGMTVLNLGCGAGLDAVVASQRVGPSGRVVGVDFCPDMATKSERTASEIGTGNFDVVVAGGEDLPLETASIDGVLINGIFNLNPFRDRLFRELGRVVKMGGMVWAAEIILKQPLAAAHRESEAAWSA